MDNLAEMNADGAARSPRPAGYATAKSVIRRILQRTKCQHDAILGYPGVEQFLRDAILRPIALDPELAVDDVDMHQAAMDPADPLPAVEHQQITIVIAIEDRLEPDIAMGIGDLGVIGQDLLDQPAIGFCGIHRRMVSVCGSKTISRMRRLSRSSSPIGSSKRLL